MSCRIFRSKQLQPVARIFVVFVLLMVSVYSQGEEEPTQDVYRVRALQFIGVSERGLNVERLLWESILLSRNGNVLSAATPSKPAEWIQLGAMAASGEGLLLDSSALKEIPTAVVRAYRRQGIAAVRVQLRRDAIDHLLAKDSDGVLTVTILEGVVSALSATVKRIDDFSIRDQDERQDARARRLLDNSPVQAGDLVAIDRLTDYTELLNRRPYRRVDIRLVPGPNEQFVELEYLISESKPWTVYAQLSNTGTKETGYWRERVGLVQQNLTGREDQLSLSFITAEFDSANAITASYEIPLSPRPHLSARLYGYWNEYRADEVGAFNLDLSGETTNLGIEFRGNLWQKQTWFTDMFIAADFFELNTRRDAILLDGNAKFLVLKLGFSNESKTPHHQITSSIHFDQSLDGIGGTRDQDVVQVGRTNTHTDWRRLIFQHRSSIYLEPLWNADTKPESLAHELQISFDATHSLGDRLPPNFTFLSGGLYSVRGYPESFMSGDRGYRSSLEYRYHWPRDLAPGEAIMLFNAPFRFRPERALGRPDWDLVFKSFVDYASLEQQDKLSFERDEQMLGMGVGLEFIYKRHNNLRIDWGFAMLDVFNGTSRSAKGDQRLHVLWTVLY